MSAVFTSDRLAVESPALERFAVDRPAVIIKVSSCGNATAITKATGAKISGHPPLSHIQRLSPREPHSLHVFWSAREASCAFQARLSNSPVFIAAVKGNLSGKSLKRDKSDDSVPGG
jgi:hypothetical protein